MSHPPSLPSDVKARAFLASNGELGVLPGDVDVFLRACKADGVEVLGWELWVVDHQWGSNNEPVPAEGLWCGGVPLRDRIIPAVVGGSGNLDETARQLSLMSLPGEVEPDWLPHVRVNFTLGD